MKKLIGLFLVSVILLSMSGCAPLIIGSAVGMVGGYAASKDTIQGDTDKSYDSLWDAALAVSKLRGNIKYENISRGEIELEADRSKVWIRIIRMTRATTRVKVSSRKYHLPNLSLAQDVFVKIMEEAQ